LQTDEENIVICIPLLDDWESATVLIRQIDMVCAQLPVAAEVLLVDDGSTAIPPAELGKGTTSLKRIDILHLRRNLGHQRAIAIGLAYIQENRPCSAVVVMDGDGEDLPRDIPRLLDRLTSDRERSVVFAKRRRRAEGLLFRTLYQVFKVVHRILTGRKVEVGNFSVIPREQLGRLVAVSETWNHYAASVFKAKIPVEMVPTDRAPRIAGTSKMNLVGLVTHGLSAMSVFADTVGVRLLLATCPMALLAVAGLLAVGCHSSLHQSGYSRLDYHSRVLPDDRSSASLGYVHCFRFRRTPWPGKPDFSAHPRLSVLCQGNPTGSHQCLKRIHTMAANSDFSLTREHGKPILQENSNRSFMGMFWRWARARETQRGSCTILSTCNGTCLEPDPELAQILADSLVENDLEDTVHVAVGTIADLPTDRAFDSILYIDVLEHIQDDAQELIMAVSRLRTSGKLIVLAPAHQRLFSEFDRSVGHFRRYDKRSLKGIAPPGLREEALIYLDSMGILASMANRLLLRQSTPTIRQIETWDRFLVPVSRLLDPLLMHKLGKTVTAVWRKL
jgi:SAM-dependent methyltransferase